MNSYLIRQNLLRVSVLCVVLAPLTVGICQFHLRRQELDPMAGVVQDGESDEHVISIACHDAHAGSDDTAAVFPCWTGHLHLLAERQLVGRWPCLHCACGWRLGLIQCAYQKTPTALVDQHEVNRLRTAGSRSVAQQTQADRKST